MSLSHKDINQESEKEKYKDIFNQSFDLIQANLEKNKKTLGFRTEKGDKYISLNRFFNLFTEECAKKFTHHCNASTFAKALCTIKSPSIHKVWKKSFSMLVKTKITDEKTIDNVFCDFQKIMSLGLYFKKYHPSEWKKRLSLKDKWLKSMQQYKDFFTQQLPMDGSILSSIIKDIEKYLFYEDTSSQDKIYLDHLVYTMIEAKNFATFKDHSLFKDRLLAQSFKNLTYPSTIKDKNGFIRKVSWFSNSGNFEYRSYNQIGQGGNNFAFAFHVKNNANVILNKRVYTAAIDITAKESRFPIEQMPSSPFMRQN